MQGEQVFISYGQQSNDSLLQYYGFIEPDIPHDTYVVPDWATAVPDAVSSGSLPAMKAWSHSYLQLIAVAPMPSIGVGRHYNRAGCSQKDACLLMQAVLTKKGFDKQTLQALRAASLSDQQIKEVISPPPSSPLLQALTHWQNFSAAGARGL